VDERREQVTRGPVRSEPTYGVLTRGAIAGWLFVLTVVALITSLFVGYAATGKAFDWQTAAVAGTAVGTVLLAGFTGALAWVTSGDVRATWELAKLTQADQEARERPVVLVQSAEWASRRVDPVPGEDVLDHTGAVRVYLRNVGLGPALRVLVSASYIYDDLQPIRIEDNVVAAIGPNEHQWAEVLITFRTQDWNDIKADGFPVEGSYLDRSRKRAYDIIASWDDE
jgi:hypothetical protein